jgi:hypothetical protein
MALAACGDKPADVAKENAPAAPEEIVHTTLPDAVPSTDAVGQPAAVILPPFNLPHYVAVRPGATVEVAQAAAPGGGAGGLVTFRTPTTPNVIAEYYRGQLEREFGAVSDADTAGVRLIAAERGAERVEVSVAAAAEGGARVTITYSLPTLSP